MPMVGDEISQSDVNKPSKREMEEETSGTPVVGGAEKCESMGDLSQSLCGEGDETSPEGASADGKGGGDPESHAAEGKTEFPVDTEAGMNKLPVVVEEEVAAGEEGGDGMVASRSEDRQIEMNDVEREAAVTDSGDAPMPAQLTVVAALVAAAPTAGEVGIEMNDARSPYESKADVKADLLDCAPVTYSGDAPMSNESEIDTKVDKLSSVGPKSEMNIEEEFSLMVNTNSEMAVIESEPQVDAREDEMLVDPQLEVKADLDLFSVVDPPMQASDIDAGDTQQIPELKMDAKRDDFLVDFDGMEALVNKSEEHLSDGKNNEAAGVDNLMVDSCEVDNKVETLVEGDIVHEEKVDVLVNDSEDGNIEKSVDVEEEKVDSVTPKATPITGHKTDVKIITEVSSYVVDTGEQEHVTESSGGLYNYGDAELDAEENLTSGTIVVEDDSMTLVLGDHMTMTENEDAIVRENLPESNDKDKTGLGEELELPRNVVAGDTQLDDAEFETKKGTDESAGKTSDEDGKMETEETNSDADEPGHDLYDSPAPLDEEEDEAMAAEEEIETQDTEMETEADVADSEKASGGKRKRGKLSKNSSTPRATTKASSRKTVGEDVCFICFDGGELVLCDRRGCPKAYHPSCVNRDEAFFKSKGRWNCGWHFCSICEKNARYMCYTCTFSLCKSCTKDAVILCVRGNKGFCQTCMRTVRLIENNEQGSQDAQVDFDDRNSWEYLFKDYYIELKAKLSLSSDEIAEAKNPWKGANVMSGSSKQEFSKAHADANDGGSGSNDSMENVETIRPKRRKTRKQPKSLPGEEGLDSTGVDNPEWASKELLEFVSHMKDGDTSLLSQFDVQALLLEYIKRNKLRDPRRKSQIMCDARLENLFGKPRVAHFEMLKLLESHFLVRDEQNDDFQGSVVDTENNQLDVDGNGDPQVKGSKDRKRKSRKKSDRGPQNNLDDYAAIDMHNIGLIYLRRKLMEDLLDDAETFHDKVIGTFVRIRISGSNQKQDLYRLVQVVGMCKAAEPYKIGKKSTDTMVEILNLDKTEIISIDTISNQEFTEEECKRLRQSIKCGLIRRLTVGEILDKTTEIQAARVNDWLESETLRLSHLRDRASDMGHRKELRECVEKLQLLKTPDERRRRIDEIPEIHADPKMDPSYESDDNDSENEDSRRDAFMRARGINRRPRPPITPGTDSSTKVTTKNWDSSKYVSGSSFSVNASHVGEIVNENSQNSERVKGTEEFNNLEKHSTSTKYELGEGGPRSIPRSDLYSAISSVVTVEPSLSARTVETVVKINESEKIWHYQDPSGKVQGPFSMVQLRKWNNTGYFPSELRIWRSTDKQENSILLADALEEKFPKVSPAVGNNTLATDNTLCTSHSSASHSVKTSEISLHEESSNLDQNPRPYSRPSAEKWRGNDFANLPSPTPRQTNSSWDAKERGALSLTSNQTPVINGVLSSPTPVSPYMETRSSAVASLAVNPPVQTAPFSPTPDSQQVTMLTSAVSLNAQPNSTSEPPTVSPNTIQMHPPPTAGVLSVQPTIGQSPQGYVWGPANVPLNSSGSFSNSGTPPAGLQPDPWRPVQAIQPNASWGMGPTENSTNPNMGWATNMMQPNPNTGWANLPPGNNASGNWGPPAVSNWGVAPPGNVGPNSNQGPVPGYVNPGWGGPSVQGPVVGNGWGPPSGNSGGPPPSAVQGQPQQENMSQGGSWGGGGGGGGGEQNHMGGQYSGGMGGQGRDSGYRGGPRPWNRPSSFGGGGFRKRDRVCPYNTNGRCRKGMHCDYLHT